MNLFELLKKNNTITNTKGSEYYIVECCVENNGEKQDIGKRQ